jgi:hypothetical protein
MLNDHELLKIFRPHGVHLGVDELLSRSSDTRSEEPEFFAPEND